MRTLCLLFLALATSAHALTPRSQPLQPARVGGSGPAWSPAQATGQPDAQPGDHQQAWATLGADEGLQWIELDYALEVPIEAVRIFENHNPGAVVKIEALAGSGPVVIWQGDAPRKPEPFVFEAVAQAKASARRVRITLDTNRVSGWNEIDAVELVGRDGSRQWATSARASSTYASVSVEGEPAVLDRFLGQRVRLGLGGSELVGVLREQTGGFVKLEQAGRVLFVNPAQIQWITAE